MTIRARATQVGDSWAVEAEHQAHAVYTQARALEEVEDAVRTAFALDGVDISGEPVEVVEMKKAPDPLLDLVTAEAASDEEAAERSGQVDA
jgi:hypothetical protein